MGDNALFALKIKIDCSMIVLRRNNLSRGDELHERDGNSKQRKRRERDQFIKKNIYMYMYKECTKSRRNPAIFLVGGSDEKSHRRIINDPCVIP